MSEDDEPSAESLREIPPNGPDAICLGRGEVGMQNARRLRRHVRRAIARFATKVADEFDVRAAKSEDDYDYASARALRYAAAYVRLVMPRIGP